MARPLEFDRNRALDSAMKLFWRQGYSATSLSQLLDSMDIGKGSFYAAFTDKHSLYAEALDLFGNRTHDNLLKIKRKHTALESVQAFFENTLFDVPPHRMRCGCMMVNSVLELSAVEQELCDLASEKLIKIEMEFEKSFAEDLNNGDLSFSQSPRDIARLVMIINQGLRVSCRKNVTTNELHSIVNTCMDTLRMALN